MTRKQKRSLKTAERMQKRRTKNRGGRPLQIADREWKERRERFFGFLTATWGEIGWRLTTASSRDDLRGAFASVKEEIADKAYLLIPFLTVATTTFTRADLRASRKAQDEAGIEEQQRRYVVEDGQARLREAETALRAASDGIPVFLQESHEDRLLLDQAERELAATQTRRETLRQHVAEVEASVSQDELLRFIRSRKYARSPGNLARAMAGLPELSSWQSFRRYRKESAELPPATAYRIFEVLSQSWSRSGVSKTALLSRLEREIRSISVTGRRKDQTFLRQELADNWRSLRLAVEESDLDASPADRVPYLLLTAFLKRYWKRRDPEQIVLDRRERIHLSASDSQ